MCISKRTGSVGLPCGTRQFDQLHCMFCHSRVAVSGAMAQCVKNGWSTRDPRQCVVKMRLADPRSTPCGSDGAWLYAIVVWYSRSSDKDHDITKKKYSYYFFGHAGFCHPAVCALGRLLRHGVLAPCRHTPEIHGSLLKNLHFELSTRGLLAIPIIAVSNELPTPTRVLLQHIRCNIWNRFWWVVVIIYQFTCQRFLLVSIVAQFRDWNFRGGELYMMSIQWPQKQNAQQWFLVCCHALTTANTWNTTRQSNSSGQLSIIPNRLLASVVPHNEPYDSNTHTSKKFRVRVIVREQHLDDCQGSQQDPSITFPRWT